VAAEVGSRDVGALSPVVDADLPQEIRPLTHALNELLGRLGHALDAQRAFIADAAHELRTPLTALKLRIQLAERAGDEAERKAAFKELEQGFERALHTVQQLLTLARQEPGASTQTRQSVDLHELAGSAVADGAAAADAKRIDLGMAGEEKVFVEGDPAAIRILLDNLIDNAIRYTQPGGRVDVSLSADASSASIAVQDNGPGIPGGEMARVFDRFYRIPGTQAEGSGLGLAIVKRIADAHGARLEAVNMNPGLRVSVVFPRSSAKTSTKAPL
jgi:two-component system OmpR family sensor kinase